MLNPNESDYNSLYGKKEMNQDDWPGHSEGNRDKTLLKCKEPENSFNFVIYLTFNSRINKSNSERMLLVLCDHALDSSGPFDSLAREKRGLGSV